MTQKDYYRSAFESITGTLTNRRWYQIRNELERSGMIINLKSVQLYARLKRNYPRTVLTKSAIKTYENFQEKYSDYSEFTGIELLEIIKTIKPKVSDRMLINSWYKSGLHFSKQTVYTYSEACKIVFFTAITRNK